MQVFCCPNFLFTKAKMGEFTTYSFLMMIVCFLRLKKYFWGSFRHSVSSVTNILIVFPPHPLRMRAIPRPATTNVDSTRFPEISSEEIEELKAVADNKNTSRSTKQWMNVFKSWCQSCHLQNVNIETMAPEELDNILSKFYAEVKQGMEIITSRSPLKSCRVPLKGI